MPSCPDQRGAGAASGHPRPSAPGAAGPSEPSPSPGPAGKQRPVSPHLPPPPVAENVWQLPSGYRATSVTGPHAPHSHSDPAQTAEPVLDDVRLLGPVERRCLLAVALPVPDAGFGRVDRNCHQVDDEVQEETPAGHLWALCQGMHREVSRARSRPGAVGPASGRDGGWPLAHPAAALRPPKAPRRQRAGLRCRWAPGHTPRAVGAGHRAGGEDMTPGLAQSFTGTGTRPPRPSSWGETKPSHPTSWPPLPWGPTNHPHGNQTEGGRSTGLRPPHHRCSASQGQP